MSGFVRIYAPDYLDQKRFALLPFDVGDDYFIDMSEYELLEAFIKKRSEEAFAELVSRYAGLVYSVARRRMANATLAEDITQIVFIRFAKTPPKVKSHAELVSWLHRTTVNVTIDTWRSETRRRNREQQATIMESNTSENEIWDEITPNLDEALNQLNEQDRQALLLRFFGRKAMRDVGFALGVSEDAAKMRVSRALDRLRTQLGVGGTACTVAVLGTILAERSVEAVPSQLISRLAALRLPLGAGLIGLGGLFGSLLRIPKFNLGVGAVVLAAIGVSFFHLVHSLIAPSSETTKVDPSINKPMKTTGIAKGERFDSSSFNMPLAPTSKPVKISFHVLDAETGDGLSNAKIECAYFGMGGSEEGHELFTDDTGGVAIPEPDDSAKTGGPNVFVVAEGHVPKVVGFQGSIPADYTIRLDPAMMAGGRVVDEQGLPVAGVKIWIQSPSMETSKIENIDFQTCPVTNRDDGSWIYNYVPKDYTNDIRFILRKDGYAVTLPIVPVFAVDLTNLVFVLSRGFTIEGNVVDLQGRSIVNASIKVINGSDNQRQSANSDENGFFTLTGVSGVTTTNESYRTPALETNASGGTIIRGMVGKGHLHATLAVQADGFAPQTSIVELAGTTNIINLALTPGSIFRGVVVDETGNPITNAVIRTDYDFNNQIEARFDWTTHTDGNGRFEWDSAPPDEICYWIQASGYSVIRGVPYLADNSDHIITLKINTAK